MKKLALFLGIIVATVCSLAQINCAQAVANVRTEDIIKGSGPAIYFYAMDGKRYVFTKESIYKTWYADFGNVKKVSDSDLASITLGGSMTVQPGTKLIKFATSPKVYAVLPKSYISYRAPLAWIQSSSAAIQLYGANWRSKIISLPDTDFQNYIYNGQILYGSQYPEGQLVQFDSTVYYINANGTGTALDATAQLSQNTFIVNAAYRPTVSPNYQPAPAPVVQNSLSARIVRLNNCYTVDATSHWVSPRNGADYLAYDPLNVTLVKNHFSNQLVIALFNNSTIKSQIRNAKTLSVCLFDNNFLSFSLFNYKTSTYSLGSYLFDGYDYHLSIKTGLHTTPTPQVIIGRIDNSIYYVENVPTSTTSTQPYLSLWKLTNSHASLIARCYYSNPQCSVDYLLQNNY